MAFMAATAGGAAEFGCLSSMATANDDDCTSLGGLCLDKAGTTVVDGHAAAAEGEKERKNTCSKRRRARRRKANRCEQGAAGYGDDEWEDLVTLLFDKPETVAERGRRMQREQQAAHNWKLCRAREAAMDRIREYDPKIGRNYYSRVEYVDDMATFNHDEECK